MLRDQQITATEHFSKRLRYHPLRVITWLSIAGVSSAFLTLITGYFATTAGTDWNSFKLPQIFHANSVIIMVSSYSVWQMRSANNRDDQSGYRNALLITVLLGLAFTIFQLLGWSELFSAGIGFRHNISGSYLYLISGLHLLHLLVGIGLLFYFLYKAYRRKNDAYHSLLFETDPVSKLSVNMVGLYWHFVDVLWLFLYVCFLVAIYAIPKGQHSWFLNIFGN